MKLEFIDGSSVANVMLDAIHADRTEEREKQLKVKINLITKAYWRSPCQQSLS